MKEGKERDTVASRLTQILMRFNNGESFTSTQLADDFGVTLRTIQKDLTERLSFLPIKKKGTRYYLAEYALGKLSLGDLKNFATFSGVRELYPEFSDELVVDLLNEKTNKALSVKGHNYEDLTHKVEEFNDIGVAVVTYNRLSFKYKDKERLVEPYRLRNTNGIWYMLATENKVLKTFTFSQMINIKHLDEEFEVDEQILEIVDKYSGTWVTQNPIEVVLEVDMSMAEYFLRRELLPKQMTLESYDEKLVLSTTVAYEEEIFKIVRYWIPHIKIRSPQSLQDKLEENLHNYLKKL